MVKQSMVNALSSLTCLSDDQLLARVRTLAERERASTTALIAALAELDARRLYLGQGFSSLFAYCTQALRLSEDAAYNRIRAARVAAKWPVVLDRIADGSVTVTAVRLLSDVLTDSNHEELFRAATHKSKREVEALVAGLNPQPDVAASIRKVTQPAVHGTAPPTTDPPLLSLTAPGSNHATRREHSCANTLNVGCETLDCRSAIGEPLQDPVHDPAGDARQASTRAGPDASHEPKGRSGGDLRPCAECAA